MKNLPLGIQTFRKIIEENRLYVDKTKDIYNLLAQGGQYYFLSRPRRFGKSLLVSRTRRFYILSFPNAEVKESYLRQNNNADRYRN